jgi:PAS domain S-box-containing protein
MQKQSIKTLVFIPRRDDFNKIHNVLHRINKWRFEVRWEPDIRATDWQVNEFDYDIIFVDDSFNKRDLEKLLAHLERDRAVVPVVLLVQNHEPPDELENIIERTAGWLGKTRLAVDDIEHLIRYTLALKRAVEQLRESQMRLRSVFLGAAIGIALIGSDGYIIQTNPGLTKITGFTDDELCTFTINDLLDRRSPDELEKHYVEMIDGRKNFFQLEERINHKNGTELWIRLTVSLFMEDKIPVRFAVALFENITERKKAQELVQHSSERIRELSRKILDAQENERKLVAQEIHDSIGGNLAAIKFALEEKLEGVEEKLPPESISLEKVISMVDETIKETRRISASLRPSLLDDMGLLTTISWFCREFDQLHPGLQIEQQLNVAEEDVPDNLKVVIYRILQEAMNNVTKHSDASKVELRLEKRDNQIEFTVEDDGCGFDPEENVSELSVLSGFGLSGMQERTNLCGGKFEIFPRKGKGVIIHISLPCDNGLIDDSI